MASKSRSIARHMAHVQMEIEGIQHPNKVLAKGFLDNTGRYGNKERTRDSRFAFAWREYFERRVQAVNEQWKRNFKRKQKGGSQ